MPGETYPEHDGRGERGRISVGKLMLRLSGGIVAVVGLWILVWLPLVLSESSAAEPQEQILGKSDAPVTIIEYASLTCPHCAEFHNKVLPELKERYIDPGKVRLIYRDFPLDQTALAAAALAHCAGPERYFSMLGVMFETQSNWARADDPIAALKQLGKLGGLSEQEMDACLADQKLTDGILRQRLAGQNEYDIGSTPTFIIDGRAYPGARDVEEFSELIDPLLDRS
jgi:protein-disulfide isomerase